MTSWIWWLIAGVLSLVGGIVALFNPFAATLTATLLTGYMFMAIGILTAISAFQDQGWGARIVSLLLGVALIVLGFNLVAEPLTGTLALTLLAGIMLLVVGVFRVLIAFAPEAAPARWPLVIAGVISMILAFMIFTNFPYSAAVALGILLAVELVSNGVSLIAFAFARKKLAAA